VDDFSKSPKLSSAWRLVAQVVQKVTISHSRGTWRVLWSSDWPGSLYRRRPEPWEPQSGCAIFTRSGSAAALRRPLNRL